MDLYETLGVDRDATTDEIRAAARRRQRETHPDHGGDEEEFKNVQHALFILRDPDKRAHYDRTGDHEAGKPQNMEEVEALATLAAAINQRMGGDHDHYDLIRSIRDFLKNEEESAQRTLDGINLEESHKVAVADNILKRLKKTRPAKGQDFVGDIVRGQRDQARMMAKSNRDPVEHRLRVLRRAIEMAKDYTYKIDPMPPQHPGPGMFHWPDGTIRSTPFDPLSPPFRGPRPFIDPYEREAKRAAKKKGFWTGS